MPDANARASGRIGRANAVAIDTDGWMDLMWEGRWQHSDGPMVAEAEDIRVTHENLLAEANAAGPDWTGIPVYVGHPEVSGTMDSAPSRAWVKQFRINSAGRLQGRAEWCGSAKADLVDSRQFKFMSNFEYGDIDPDTGVFHPAYISSIGLTNNPVKKAGQHPLANAKGDKDMPDADGTKTTGIALVGRPNAVSDKLAARIEEIIGDAADQDTALERIYVELSAAWARVDELDATVTLIYTMANALGVAVAADADVQTRCNALETGVQALREDRDGLVVDLAVRDCAVVDSAEGRANALRLVKADPEGARAHFADSAGTIGRGNASADPLVGGMRPQRANAVQPTEGEGERQANAETVQKITTRANALFADGGNWDVAWSRACAEIEKETKGESKTAGD